MYPALEPFSFERGKEIFRTNKITAGNRSEL